MKLYEIKGQFTALDSINLESDDDIQAFGDLYKSLEVSLTEKIENCCMVIRNAESEAEAIKAEIDRLRSRKSAIENKVDNLKSYMQHELESIGVDSVKGSLFSVKVALNPESVAVTCNAHDLAPEYQMVKIEPCKTAIKADLQNGIIIPGCALVRTKGLRIK
jgi:archaellum component FlaC